jgi:DDE superfamily endonuclease
MEELAFVLADIHRMRRDRRLKFLRMWKELVKRRRICFRSCRWGSNRRIQLDKVSPTDFVENFRFTHEEFERVVAAYQLPDVIPIRQTKQRVPGRIGLAVVLARLASYGAWRQFVDFLGMKRSTLKAVFYETLKMMFPSACQRIQKPSRAFLTDERLSRYCDAIHAKGSPYRNVFGFIDGTVYEICRPCGDYVWQRSVYNGHKKTHGLKFQGISSPDGIIQFLHGPYQGRLHDITILEESNVIRVLRERFRLPPNRLREGIPDTHFMLFGDPGNSCVSFCL